MFEWLKKIFSQEEKSKEITLPDEEEEEEDEENEEEEESDYIEIRNIGKDEEDILVLDIDRVPPDEREDLHATVTELTDLPFFEDNVEHFYTLKYAKQIHQCPRCGDLLQQQYADWVYATKAGKMRIMLAPAGYFCLKCPTVIVDENLIKSGIDGNYKYREILSIAHDDGVLSGMATLNGKEVVLLVRDEAEEDVSWVSPDYVPSEHGRKKISSNRKSTQRKRMQKNSKKQQRAKRKKKKRKRK
ncbi:hypothetical protein QUF58_00290 [Anaerolineales bacterium HSG24]|nr:hypothetical protein [Anaerolineales bacterium HSG24]